MNCYNSWVKLYKNEFKNGMLKGLKYHMMIFKMPCVSQTNSMVLMYKCIVQDFQPPKTKTYGDYKY